MYMGVNLIMAQDTKAVDSFPHVYGGDSTPTAPAMYISLFSPYVYGGNPTSTQRENLYIEFSPYYMGVILRYIATLLKKGYFPHASGGDSQIEGMKNQAIGFSSYIWG